MPIGTLTCVSKNMDLRDNKLIKFRLLKFILDLNWYHAYLNFVTFKGDNRGNVRSGSVPPVDVVKVGPIKACTVGIERATFIMTAVLKKY